MVQRTAGLAPASGSDVEASSPTALQREPRELQPWVWMAVAAFAVRIALILLHRSYHFSAVNEHYSFGLETGSIARALAAREGFSSPFKGHTGPTAWLAPLYPAMVALVFKLCGTFSDAAGFVVLAINSFFSALTCAPIYHIGRRTVGRAPALWAGWLWAVVPHFGKWPTEWVWEISLSALFVGLVYWLTLVLAERKHTRSPEEDQPTRMRWGIFGVLWGIVFLTNPALATLLPFSLAWIWLHGRRRGFVRHVVLVVVIAFVIIAPWLARNRVVMGHWVFLRDNFGFELHLGNYHGSFGMGWGGRHPSVNPLEYERYLRVGEVAYVAEHQREALAFIRQYPREFAELCWKRFASFWDGRSLLVADNPAPWTPSLFFAFSLVAALGLALAFDRRIRGAGLFAWIVLYPLPYYITYPQPRYRHAVEPEMLLLVCFAVAEAWRRVRIRLNAGTAV